MKSIQSMLLELNKNISRAFNFASRTVILEIKCGVRTWSERKSKTDFRCSVSSLEYVVHCCVPTADIAVFIVTVHIANEDGWNGFLFSISLLRIWFNKNKKTEKWRTCARTLTHVWSYVCYRHICTAICCIWQRLCFRWTFGYLRIDTQRRLNINHSMALRTMDREQNEK